MRSPPRQVDGELRRQPLFGAAGVRDRAGFTTDAAQSIHECRDRGRWAVGGRATQIPRRRLDCPARRDGPRDRAVVLSCFDLQRR